MPIDLADLDARYAALKTHQLPAYTGKPTPSGYIHRGRWDAHVKKHNLPPVMVTIPVPGNHRITIIWEAKFDHNALGHVDLRTEINGSSNHYSYGAALDIRDVRPGALDSAIHAAIAETEAPSATIRAIVDHLAALTDAEAARWATHSANLRALLGA